MEKNMNENFVNLERRVIDCLENTDFDLLECNLRGIKDATLVSGVGGSHVVSEFTSKVLREKNKIIAINVEPRDFAYEKLNGFKNVLSCSYGGRNYGVELSFNNNLKHYLLSVNEATDKNVTSLKYNTTIENEKSFISLAATLMPVVVMLKYYLGVWTPFVIDNFTDYYLFDKEYIFGENSIFEIFSGIETSTASTYLESTITEAGLGIPIVHDKYSYCHGRSTMSNNYNSTAIYFNMNTELDKLMLDELPKYYKNIIVLNEKNNYSSDHIVQDYLFLVECMYLTKRLAEHQEKDLSGVDYSPIVKKLYKYNGNL